MQYVKEKEKLEEEFQTNSNRSFAYKRHALIGVVLISILFSSMFGAVFGLMSAGLISFFSPDITQRLHQQFPNLITADVNSHVNKQQVIVEDSAVIDVVQRSTPAVVSIIISKNVPANTPSSTQSGLGGLSGPFGNIEGDHKIQGPASQGQSTQQIGEGSGFFITSDGLILTNRHVVDDSQATYTVLTNEGKKFVANVLAIDPARDIAIIKIDGYNFPILPLGNSESIQIGQTIIAIGNSLGQFTNSVSRGIVAGLKRNLDAGSEFGSVERLTDIIQTDAAINPGNSGGPLIDIDGNVVGINVAMAQGAQNIGFALPINQAKRLIDQVKNGKKISVPFIGIRYIVIDQTIQKEAQLPFDYGVLVVRGTNSTDLAVIPGSPADIAGITENDIILEVNGEKVTNDNQLEDIISKFNVGDTLKLKVWHKSQIKDLQLTLQELKQ